MVDSRMHFTFSDTIAGSVVAFQADEDTFTLKTIDGREFEVKLTSQTFAEVTAEPRARPTSTQRRRCGTCSIRGRMLFAYGIFYPEGGGVTFEAKHIVFVGRTAHDFVFERPDWWIRQVREIADFFLRGQFPDGNIDYAEYRTRPARGGEAAGDAPGDGHDLAARLRLRDRVPADRRGSLPRGGRGGDGLPARAHAHRRRRRRHRLLGARHRHLGREGEEDPRLRVRRRLRRDPGVRADLRARRPDADLPHHRATRGSSTTSR